ncbi:hypothetical protein [Photobacterium sp. 1_MG-2023]|uniref:hypothetical protein n=1 Tax=Photobacterium sp. 1_MG-2023 TaxID=3062646 RepID=UPI0026E2775B|nr:hypothetical protein [Photobacterium sp. 1_MG-2023]MDO6708238.1 hypothetical protein [Photobacterium sp. 1_MG-2023]
MKQQKFAQMFCLKIHRLKIEMTVAVKSLGLITLPLFSDLNFAAVSGKMIKVAGMLCAVLFIAGVDRL